jgi:hypothetical protein
LDSINISLDFSNLNVNKIHLISILFLLFSIFFIILKFVKPKIKGKYGEYKVSLKLRRLSSKGYKVINNLLITNKSSSSQIDHVVISTYGIFVIETKHYKGWIFGHESSNDWTQTLYKQKYKIRNPIIQNWGHIKTLRSVLSEFPNIKYFPIIVFTGKAKLKKITTEVPVITSNKLIRYILKNSISENLSLEEVVQIHQKLNRIKCTDNVSRKSHIIRAKTAKRRIPRSLICPRCGGRLILKEGKYGSFYGCSKFPSCDYSKDYSK